MIVYERETQRTYKLKMVVGMIVTYSGSKKNKQEVAMGGSVVADFVSLPPFDMENSEVRRLGMCS